MKLFTKALLSAATFMISCSTATAAHRVELNNGDTFLGEIEHVNNAIIIQTEYGKLTIPEANIKVIKELRLTRLTGSRTIGGKLAPALAEGFLYSAGIDEVERGLLSATETTISTPPEFPYDHTFSVQTIGSDKGFEHLASGAAEMAMSSRPIRPQEQQSLRQQNRALDSDNTTVIALDGIVILVHPDNPIKQLSRDTIRQIFSGEITQWSQLKEGMTGPIHLYRREKGSGTSDSFNTLLMQGGKIAFSPQAVEMTSDQDLSNKVASDVLGIGFTAYAYTRNAKALSIDECGITSSPTPFTIKTEEYPLSRRLYLYSTPRLTGIGRHFRIYAASDDAQEIIEENGFINLTPILSPETLADARAQATFNRFVENKEIYILNSVQNYLKQTKGATRLSLDLRFKSGSTELDTRAQQDVQRLAEFMSRVENKGKHVLLLGFADNIGDPTQNLILSRTRAKQVADQLYRKGVADITSHGIGSDIPVACNTTPITRQKNRRVEVWIK